jgi:methylated-DNA-[protein]-cysteine S-methyltransferase
VTRIIDSPCGPLAAGADSEALCYLGFGREIPAEFETEIETAQAAALLDRVELQLTEYFQGVRREFDIPLKLFGSVFRQAVWAGLMGIPYGQTVTYGQLACMIGKPGSSRAVGGANHNNPVSIIVPCHRVIGSGNGHWSGRLTGYGGGLRNKKLLLELEKINL